MLDKLVLSYNLRKHRTIGLPPIDVTENEVAALLKKLYPPADRIVNFNFLPGQSVRIALEKTAFAKGYTPNWSAEIFYIAEQPPTSPPTYKIRDAEGEPIMGSYYKQELQSVQRGAPVQAELYSESGGSRSVSPEL